MPLLDRLRSAAFSCLAALAGAKAGFLAIHLRYSDLALDYPFPGGDGLDWLNNGLAWTGAPVRNTARPPVLPWILAVLDRLHALPWAPLLGQLVLPIGVLALFVTLLRWYRAPVAFAASLVPLASAAATGHGLELMADTLASVLLFLALGAFLEADRRPSLYLAAGALGAASALTQQAALLVPLPLGLAILATRRADLRRPQLWLGATLFALPCTAWFLAKALVFGSDGARHWSGVSLQLDALPYYGAALAGLVGLPACALALAGAVRLVRRQRRAPLTWVSLGVVVTLAGFFAFFYEFRLQRLLLYLLLPLGILVAEGLVALRRPFVQALAAVAAVLWAAWPAPGAPEIDSGFVLLPVPGLFAFAGPSAPPLLWAAPADAWHAGPWGRVVTARPLRPPGTPKLDGARLGEGAVVVLRRAGDPHRRGTQDRLGAALRRRVQVVDEDLYPPDWWGWRKAQLIGPGDRYVFFRIALPLAQRATLVAFHRDDPAWRALRDRPPGAAAPPSAARIAAIARLSARLERLLGPDDPFVAILGTPGDERLRLLPFTLRTSSLFVLTGDGALWARQELARHPVRLVGKPMGVPVFATRLRGFRTLVVDAEKRAPGSSPAR